MVPRLSRNVCLYVLGVQGYRFDPPCSQRDFFSAGGIRSLTQVCH